MTEQDTTYPAPVSGMRARLEAIMLVIDAPVSTAQLARVLETTPALVEQELRAMAAEFDARGSGFDLRESEDCWRLYTRSDYADSVERFVLDGEKTKLTRAALETLAVVAYRQPVTRAQVAAVRGVNVDGVMRTLAQRGLIREVDPPEPSTGAHRYETTQLFLETLGIEDLGALPSLAPLLPDVESIEEQF